MNLESLTKEQLVKEAKALKKRNEELMSENASVREESTRMQYKLEEQQETDLAKLGKHLEEFRKLNKIWDLKEEIGKLWEERSEWIEPYEERIRELERALADQCVRNNRARL